MIYVALGGLVILVVGAYWWETHSQPPETRSRLRRAVIWSVVWLVLGLLPTALFGLSQGSRAGSSYAAIYLIERALSLDNVFVFAVLIAAFEIPAEDQERLVSSGALSAFALRVPAILAGVAVFDASHLVSYALGALLLVLAWQTLRSHGGQPGGPSRLITALQRRLPVSEHVPHRWMVRRDGQRYVTPMLLCLGAIVLADIAFALDSIPAALAISHEPTLLLSANLLALLGLRPLYQLLAVAREHLLYMDQTIAALLLLVGVKLLGDGLHHVGPLTSLLAVLVVLGGGVGASLLASRSSGARPGRPRTR
jgi:tellurite resistance protein TerC